MWELSIRRHGTVSADLCCCTEVKLCHRHPFPPGHNLINTVRLKVIEGYKMRKFWLVLVKEFSDCSPLSLT